ncbi:MAG: gliding motility-associated C-terminal domain-containing protein [Bacteroidota bacterium]
MLKRLFPITLLSLFAITALAQTPRPVNSKPVDPDNQPENALACLPGFGNEAGTVSLGPFTGSSNDVDFDTMYLCLGDQVLIDHDAGSESFAGDPVPTTDAGIGYAIYDCAPDGSFNGDLQTIQNDPCLTTFPPPPMPATLPWIATPPNTTGDLLFINTGDLQTFFAGGAPFLKFFVPITYDNLIIDPNGIGVADYEGIPTGPCVDINEQEAFAVVYLNEIEISDIQSTLNNGGNTSNCEGSFRLDGGLPEFDGTEAYNISITLDGNPSETATITNGSASHGETVEFKINVPGVYNIVVSDGKGCPATATVDMTGCTALQMTVDDVTGTPGTTVCVPVTVQNFNNIFSFQYSMSWDPAVVTFSSINFQALQLPDLSIVDIGDTLTVSFFDFSGSANAITLADGTAIFEVCFNIVGPIGSSTPVVIDGNPTIIDVFDVNNTPLGLVVNNGSVTVVNQGAFDIAVTGQDASCNGDMDGSFTLTVNGTGGGTPPYSVNWSEVGNPTNNGSITSIPANGTVSQPGLGAGTYALVITDSNNPAETELDTIVIEEPLILGTNISVTQPILCFGNTNGSFTADVIVGGILISNPGPDYTYQWTPGNVTTQTISNVIPGNTYCVTVTDGNNCTAVACTTPSQPQELTIDLDVVDASCSGIDNGEITATPAGGVVNMGYAYEWSTDPVQTTQTATGLAIGTYTVTVTDDNGCTASAVTNVLGATIIFANSTVQNVTCNGADDGAIFHNPTVIGVDNGGYTYQWANGVSTTNSASPVAPGTYTTTITDAVGCNIDTTIVITEPDVLEIVGGIVATTDEACNGTLGTAMVTVQGGTPAASGYIYNWSNDPTETTNMSANIPTGSYTITVLDSLNCSATLPFTINPPTPPTITGFDSVSVLCPTDMNGELTVFATEGNAPITEYFWGLPNGSISAGQTITGLGAGLYFVTVTAADGCQTVDSTSLFAPEQLMLVQPLPSNPNCFGQDDGTVAVEMSGGTTPYQYQWSANANNSTNAVVPGLVAGTYTVTVTDANNCDQVVAEVTLQDPDSITIVFDNINPVSCFGDNTNCDGQATALASGGNAPSAIYTFNWSSGESTIGMSGMAVELCQGDQTVTVIDENGCDNTATVNIPSPPELGINSVETPPTCNGDADGSIEGIGTGGTPGYSFDWGNGNTDPILPNLTAGIYPVTITDFNGCEFETEIELTEPPLLMASLDIANTNNITCAGDADGQIAVSFTGGNGDPTTYAWSGGVAPSNSNIATNLSAGTYFVTVSDVNGCSDVVQYTVTEPIPVFAIIPQPEEPICNGDQTIMTVDTAFGGVGGPYTFSIEGGPAQDIGTPISVFAGEQEVIVTDSAGCTFEEIIFINEPLPVEVNLGDDIEVQLGEMVQLNAVLSGSNVPLDSIIWTPNMFDSISCVGCLSPIVSPLDDITYTVEVFNINGCNGSDDIFIEVDKNRNVFIPNVFTPNGDGFNDIFQVFSGPGVANIDQVTIFDRWGEVVYNVQNIAPTPFEDFDNGWDGRLNGKIMNPGVFVYLIEVTFDDGITLLYRGDVTLLD